MADTPDTPKTPHRRYEDLPVVVDYDEYPGFALVCAVVDGTLVPLGHHSVGDLEQMQKRWSDLGGAHADTPDAATNQGLQDRLAKLERAAIANGWQLDQPAGTADEHGA